VEVKPDVDLTIFTVLRDTVMITCIVLIPPLLVILTIVVIRQRQNDKLQTYLIDRLERLTITPVSSIVSPVSADIERRVERAESGLLVLYERDKNTALLLQGIRDDIAKQTAVVEAWIAAMQSRPVAPIVVEKPVSPGVQKTVQNYFEHSDTGRNKLSRKLLNATEWVAKNDPDNRLSVREVARLAGVSVGTAQTAIKLVTDER